MRTSEKAIFAALIWAVVFPGVTAINYIFEALALDWPLYAKIAVSTALTVPFISLLATPVFEKVIAWQRGQTRAELKCDQAEEANGPDPA
ncbi:MAG: hypothetical protein ACU0CO_00545 [Shimia sp.]